MAFLMAKKAAEARKKGGSPTAFDEWIAFLFGAFCWQNVKQIVNDKVEIWCTDAYGLPSKRR